MDNLSIILEKQNLKLCTAESCTGGMIAVNITDRAGSSQIFDRGFVTYSNDSKCELLNVDKNILNTHGAVSNQCARAMAEGALRNSQSDITISTTGIAGPDGGSLEKPVGLVFFAISSKFKETQSFHSIFKGNRGQIRSQATTFALSKLIAYLGEKTA